MRSLISTVPGEQNTKQFFYLCAFIFFTVWMCFYRLGVCIIIVLLFGVINVIIKKG